MRERGFHKCTTRHVALECFVSKMKCYNNYIRSNHVTRFEYGVLVSTNVVIDITIVLELLNGVQRSHVLLWFVARMEIVQNHKVFIRRTYITSWIVFGCIKCNTMRLEKSGKLKHESSILFYVSRLSFKRESGCFDHMLKIVNV